MTNSLSKLTASQRGFLLLARRDYEGLGIKDGSIKVSPKLAYMARNICRQCPDLFSFDDKENKLILTEECQALVKYM